VLGAIICTHSYPVGILIAVAALWGCRELANLQGRYWISITGSAILLMTPFLDRYPHIYLHIANTLLCLLGIYAGCKWLKHPILGDLVGLWVAAPMASAFLLHGGDTHRMMFDSRTPLLLAIVPVWAGDSAAILFGKFFGKRKLAPTISPKKTVEGAIANFVFTAGIAPLVGIWVQIPFWPSLTVGIAAGILGQIGDLYESWIKRQCNKKDSGTIFPGHGGVLDRLDSLLFPILFASLLLTTMQLAK
jgi:CDP-diglyceride synthetase